MAPTRILLIEDDKKASRLLTKGLYEEGFIVDAIYSAEESDERSIQTDYDLIILDWFLPGKQGLALCQELRQQNIKIPILMLTAKDALKDRVTGLDAGADDYLTKPFAFEELLARIRALLRRSELAQPGILTAADLTLDPHSHRVMRGGIPIVLTQKECVILEILMRRVGKIVSRSTIAEHIWKTERIGLDNLIDAHIRNLRKKIDHQKHQSLIQTVRGRGFRLSPNDCQDV